MRKYLHSVTPILVSMLVLTLLWMLFFWRLLTPNAADRVIFPEGDFTQHYFAFSDYQMQRLAQGEFPLWNPYNHAGDPFAANIQFVAFYPPRLLAALIAADDWSLEAYQLEVAAHYWLASLLMFAFVYVMVSNGGTWRAMSLPGNDTAQHDSGTRRLTSSPYRAATALFGSVLYTYSGYLTGYPMLQVSVLESVVWLPLMMLGVHLSITREGTRWTVWGCALGGIGMALSLLGGHPQTTMQLTYLALAYLAAMTWYTCKAVGERSRALPPGEQRSAAASPLRRFAWQFALRAALFGGVGVGLAMIQLLPAAEFTRLSYRVTQLGFEDKANGFLAGDFLQIVWPRLFGVWSPLYLGVGGLLLALGAMLRPRRIHLFWMGVIAVGLFLSMGRGSIVFDLFYNVVPGFSVFRQQERIASVMVFALVVLAARQLGWLLGDASRGASWQDTPTDNADAHSRRVYGWLVYGYAAFLVMAYVVAVVVDLLRGAAASANPTSAPNVFGFTAIIGVFFAVWYAWIHRVGTQLAVSLQVAPLILLLVVDLFTVGTRSDNFLPDTPANRVSLLPALADLPVAPQDVSWRVDGAASLQGNGVLFRVPDIYGTGPFSLASIEELRLIPVDRFWEVLAVRYVTTAEEPPPGVAVELLAYDVNYTGQVYKLFELRDPRPMAHLVYDYRQASGDPVFARQIMSDSRVNLREMAVTLRPLPFDLPGARPELSRVENFRLVTPEHAEMTVSTGTDALLTIAILNYPGWKASVNGEPVAIVDVYAGLIGVPIRAGDNQTVRLEFQPDSVRWGGIVTGLTLLLVIGAAAGVSLIGRRVRQTK